MDRKGFRPQGAHASLGTMGMSKPPERASGWRHLSWSSGHLVSWVWRLPWLSRVLLAIPDQSMWLTSILKQDYTDLRCFQILRQDLPPIQSTTFLIQDGPPHTSRVLPIESPDAEPRSTSAASSSFMKQTRDRAGARELGAKVVPESEPSKEEGCLSLQLFNPW